MKKYIEKIWKKKIPNSVDRVKPGSDEQGIALLMTLGMLSMLLIIGLGFATNATMNAKGTSVAIDKTNAEFLLQSGIARVVYLANSGKHEIVSHGYRDKYNFSQCDWIYKISDNQNRMMMKPYEKLFGSSGKMIYKDLTWEYITGPYNDNHEKPFTAAARYANKDVRKKDKKKGIKENHGDNHYTDIYEQDEEQIYGRIAYWLAPSNALDPAALVSKEVDESKDDEKRFGQRVSEINIWALNDVNGNPDTAYDEILGNSKLSASVNVNQFNYDNCTAGGGGKLKDSWGNTTPPGYKNYIPYPCGYGWATPTKNDSIFTQLFSSITVPDEDPFRHWFAENPVPSQEKLWIDYNLDGSFDDSEMFHRFNICRGDWNSLTAEDIMGEGLTPQSVNGVDVYYPTKVFPKKLDKNDVSSTEDGELIPWLANWRERGTFETGRARGYQIAANLVDYCDTDDEPTSDVDPKSWDENNVPAYTGNEESYYINEVYLKCQFNITQETDSSTGQKRNVYTADCNIYVELANIYPGLAPTAYDVYIDGTGTIIYADESGADHIMTFNSAHAKMDAPFFPGDDYTTYHISLPASYTTNYANSPATPKVKKVKIEVRNIWTKAHSLFGSGIQGFDFCSFKQYDNAGNVTATSKVGDLDTSGTINGTGTYFAQLDMSIGDPRQNLNYDDWMDFKMVSGTAEDPNVGTVSANNKDIAGNEINPSTSNRDAETVTTLVDHAAGDSISTAYIRNDKMISPWEIGFIHRAAQWETINLHEYNAFAQDTSNGGTLGGGYYTDDDDKSAADPKGSNGGDANILDQIKTESFFQTPMKVSLACDDKTDIFYALVYHVQIGDDPDDFASGYTLDSSRQIKDAGAAKVAQAIGEIGATLTSRSGLAGITALKDGSCGLAQDDDASQEELIGKIVNLTSVDTAEGGSSGGTSNIKAVVLVQVIKDMGGYKKYKGSQPDDPKSYVPQEISIFRDIDGNGVIEDITTKIKETGFDIDGMNYTLKSVVKNYDQLDSLSGTDKLKLQGKYENLNSAYSDDTTIKPSVSHDSKSYEKIKATLGRYDQYVDRISYEMKAVVELKWDSAVSKYKIVRYELLGE